MYKGNKYTSYDLYALNSNTYFYRNLLYSFIITNILTGINESINFIFLPYSVSQKYDKIIKLKKHLQRKDIP